MFSINLEPEPRLLDQVEPASQERLVPTVRLRLVEVDRQGPGLLCRGPSRAAGDSCTAWRWDRVAAVIDQLDVRGVLSVPVQSDGRPVGTLDVHASSRGLVGRS